MAKSKILSGEELWNQRKIMAQSVPITGVKEYAPDGSWLEKKRLQCFYSDRRDILSEERLDKLSSLARAEWQAELGVAEIKKDLGKFNSHVGHMLHCNRKVLYPEEALMLLESNSLEIYFKDVSLSVQEAFATLLSKDITLEQYQVFNHLSRFGYIVRRHQERYVPTEYEKKLGLDRFIETNLENQKQAKFDRLSRYGRKYSKKHRELSEDETSSKQMETEKIQEGFDSTRNESSENKEKNQSQETSVDDCKKNVFNNENIFAKSSSESKSINKKKEMEFLENFDLKEHTESSKKQERNRNKETSINDKKKIMCINENVLTSNSSEIQSNSKNAAEMVQENCDKLETYYKDSQSKNKDKDYFKDIRAVDILDKLQSTEFENHDLENDPGENKFNDVKDRERKKKHSKNKFNDVKDHGQKKKHIENNFNDIKDHERKKKHRDRHYQDYERKEHRDKHLDSVDHLRKEHRKKRSSKKSSHDKIRDSKSKESDVNLYSFLTQNDRNIQDKEENFVKSHGSPCKRRKCSSNEESSQHLQEHSVQHRHYWSELDHITCPVNQSKKIYTCWEFSEIYFPDFGGGQTDIELKSPTENLLPPNIKIRQSVQPLNISNFIEEQNFQSRRQYNKSRQRGYDEPCSGWNYKPPVHTKANNWAEYKIELQKTLSTRSTLDYNLPNSGVRPLVDWRSSKSLEMVIRRLDIIPVIKKYEQKDLKLEIPKIMYDVYLPDPNFKKSNPGVPDHYLMVLSYLDPPPLQSHLAYMMRSLDDNRPLHIAVVDHGDISFYAFNNISLRRYHQVRK